MNRYAQIAAQRGQSIALYTASKARKFIEVVSADGTVETFDVTSKRDAVNKAVKLNALAWNF